MPIYARFAEVLPDGRGRVHDGRRWVEVDAREIIRATKRAILDEMLAKPEPDTA